MRSRRILTGLLALASCAGASCGDRVLPRGAADDARTAGPWVAFDRSKKVDVAPHGIAQVTPRGRPRWTGTEIYFLQLLRSEAGGPSAPQLSIPRGEFHAPLEVATGSPANMRNAFADAGYQLSGSWANGDGFRWPEAGFLAGAEIHWQDVDRCWATLAEACSWTRWLRLVSATSMLGRSHWRLPPQRQNRATVLVAELTSPLEGTGRTISIAADDGAPDPFPPVTIHWGGATFQFPGGDPYATAERVEEANRAWRKLTEHAQQAVSDGTSSADLVIGARVPWAHVAQALAILCDAGTRRLRLPGSSYGVTLWNASMPRPALGSLPATTFVRRSPWPWIGAGLALASLLSAGAWVSGRPRRRQASSTAQP